jgi:two-component system, OmpR family, sensor kinase
MAKSLRWRLQVWHAIILACVVVGFAAALYIQMRRTTLGDIDEELLSGARVIEASLRKPPPPGFRPGRPGPGPGPGPRPMNGREENFEFGTQAAARVDPVSPSELPGPGLDGGPGRTPSPGNPPQEERDFLRRGENVFDERGGGPPRDRPFAPGPPRESFLSLPDSMMRVRRESDPLPYFAVFGPRGERLAGFYDDVAPEWPSREFLFRNVGPRREVLLRGPERRLIVVGRDVSPTIDGLNRLLVPIGLSGVGVLGIGLLGGWWLAGRAIEPLKRISETAANITAKNLTSRIDVKEMDTELEQLGTILNSMLHRLETSFEQQVQFVADASHELRTPISVLSMHCELALSRSRTPEEYERTLTTCLRASNRMKSLVEDLLTLARADSGQLMAKSEPLDLSLIADECVQLISPLADKHQVKLVMRVSPCPCRGDSNQLLRLMNNLLTNGILYNQPEGSVVLEVQSTPEHAMIIVEDTGVGMEPEEVTRLFERFYRVDEARSRETGGSGLGLSICQSIAQAHGGTITVTSKKNVGTRVEVRLPS